MATVSRFEDLEVWQLAREQAKDIFQIIQGGTFQKDFELRDQIKRSTGSVMDNIAEGFERFSAKEFIQALVIAKGSNGEVRSQLYRAFDRHHITQEMLDSRLMLSETIGNKLMSFIKYLSSSNYKTKKRTSTNTKTE